MFDLHYLYLFV